MRTTIHTRHGVFAILLAIAVIAAFAPTGLSSAAARLQQDDTGFTAQPCGTTAALLPTTPAAAQATPTDGAAATIEFDQFFIDMNIPHHAAIVAGSAAALTRLQDVRLRAIATENILDQSTEVGDLRDLRNQLYGSSTPRRIDDAMMAAMNTYLGADAVAPAEMAMQLDPAAMARQLCSASTDSVDVLFIDLVVAHHQLAVSMAQAAIDQAQNDDLRMMAAHALQVQQAQIQELQQIRGDLAS